MKVVKFIWMLLGVVGWCSIGYETWEALNAARIAVQVLSTLACASTGLRVAVDYLEQITADPKTVKE
jgi:hypothetical protein